MINIPKVTLVCTLMLAKGSLRTLNLIEWLSFMTDVILVQLVLDPNSYCKFIAPEALN